MFRRCKLTLAAHILLRTLSTVRIGIFIVGASEKHDNGR